MEARDSGAMDSAMSEADESMMEVADDVSMSEGGSLILSLLGTAVGGVQLKETTAGPGVDDDRLLRALVEQSRQVLHKYHTQQIQADLLRRCPELSLTQVVALASAPVGFLQPQLGIWVPHVVTCVPAPVAPGTPAVIYFEVTDIRMQIAKTDNLADLIARLLDHEQALTSPQTSPQSRKCLLTHEQHAALRRAFPSTQPEGIAAGATPGLWPMTAEERSAADRDVIPGAPVGAAPVGAAPAGAAPAGAALGAATDAAAAADPEERSAIPYGLTADVLRSVAPCSNANA